MLRPLNYGSVCNHITAVIWLPSTRKTAHLRSPHHTWDTATAVAKLSFVNLAVAVEKRRRYPGSGISEEERIPKANSFPTGVNWHRIHVNARRT